MPHLVLEYSSNLGAQMKAGEVVKAGHQAMIASGLFNTPDIKTRAYETTDYYVGEKGASGSFVHATVALLEGRTIAQRESLSGALRDALAKALGPVDQLSVDVRDMTRESYRKGIPASAA